MKRLACVASLLALLMPAVTLGADVGVDGTTIIRMEERSVPGFSEQSIIPATQYLGLDVEGVGVKELSAHFYGWGRIDLGDDSGESRDPGSTDGNFTYGYLQYRFAKANANLKAGRFFVYEGVAAEQIDGVYARTDLKHGFTVSAFGGVPVKLDRGSSTKGDYIGGGRLGYRYGGVLDIGLSGLHEEDSPTTWGKDSRQIAGLDLWLSPHRMVELSGRSSYNGSTEEIAEHSYLLTARPLTGLTVAATYADIRLQDYFTFTNTPSLFKPTIDDDYKSYGLSATYRVAQLPFPTEVTIDYRRFNRDTTGDSDRYGGEIRMTPLNKLKTGLSYAWTAAADDIMSYNELRAFGMYHSGSFSVNLDVITNIYDEDVYDKKSAYELVAGAGYQITPALKLSGEASYADNPWNDGDLKGLLRLTYSYTNKKGVAQ